MNIIYVKKFNVYTLSKAASPSYTYNVKKLNPEIVMQMHQNKF